MKKLIATLNKQLRIEAGIKTIILGDFNLDFSAGNTGYALHVKKELKDLGFD